MRVVDQAKRLSKNEPIVSVERDGSQYVVKEKGKVIARCDDEHSARRVAASLLIPNFNITPQARHLPVPVRFC